MYGALCSCNLVGRFFLLHVAVSSGSVLLQECSCTDINCSHAVVITGHCFHLLLASDCIQGSCCTEWCSGTARGGQVWNLKVTSTNRRIELCVCMPYSWFALHFNMVCVCFISCLSVNSGLCVPINSGLCVSVNSGLCVC